MLDAEGKFAQTVRFKFLAPRAKNYRSNQKVCRFERADITPERQRARAVGAPEMSAEMRLIGKTGFARYLCDREPFLKRQQELLGALQPATQQVLMRGEAYALGKQFTKMRHAQSRRARHFFAAKPGGEVGLHQSDGLLDAALLSPRH
jgi:hypothetical protein